MWEWCQDGTEPAFYADGPERDPVAPWHEPSGGRIFRGGGFGNPPFTARSAYRTARAPTIALYHLGVRPAWPITE